MVTTCATVRWTVAGFGPGRAAIVREKPMMVNIDVVSGKYQALSRPQGPAVRSEGTMYRRTL